MKIYIGSDHAGFELKEKLVFFLKSLNYDVEDKGAYTYDANDDYPDFVKPVAEAVSADPKNSRGIVLGGSGEGEGIATDRFKNVRTAVWYGGDLGPLKLSREHNDANILSLGARFISSGEAQEAVKLWLETPFSNDERHVRRISKLD